MTLRPNPNPNLTLVPPWYHHRRSDLNPNPNPNAKSLSPNREASLDCIDSTVLASAPTSSENSKNEVNMGAVLPSGHATNHAIQESTIDASSTTTTDAMHSSRLDPSTGDATADSLNIEREGASVSLPGQQGSLIPEHITIKSKPSNPGSSFDAHQSAEEAIQTPQREAPNRIP